MVVFFGLIKGFQLFNFALLPSVLFTFNIACKLFGNCAVHCCFFSPNVISSEVKCIPVICEAFANLVGKEHFLHTLIHLKLSCNTLVVVSAMWRTAT